MILVFPNVYSMTNNWHDSMTWLRKIIWQKLFQRLPEITVIRPSRTTPYNPMSKGLCERMSKTIINMLEALPKCFKSNRKNHAKYWYLYKIILKENLQILPLSPPPPEYKVNNIEHKIVNKITPMMRAVIKILLLSQLQLLEKKSKKNLHIRHPRSTIISERLMVDRGSNSLVYNAIIFLCICD